MDDLEYPVEPIVAAVVWIRNGQVVPGLGIEIPKKGELCSRFADGLPEPFELAVVVAVHRQDEVELGEVCGSGLTGRALQPDPMTLCHCGRARIRRLAHVPGSRSGGIHLESNIEARRTHEVGEDPLGERGAADVSETDEEDPV